MTDGFYCSAAFCRPLTTASLVRMASVSYGWQHLATYTDIDRPIMKEQGPRGAEGCKANSHPIIMQIVNGNLVALQFIVLDC